jgi:hypothetical protein
MQSPEKDSQNTIVGVKAPTAFKVQWGSHIGLARREVEKRRKCSGSRLLVSFLR